MGTGSDEARLDAIGTRPSLRDEVLRTLQAAVISGEMRPGITYSAPQLAQQLGVSATPVREAMLDLVKEGLIHTVRNKGFRVVELSERELDELTELRLLLEVSAVRTIAQRGIEPSVMRVLRNLAEQIVAAGARREFVMHNKVDLEFHALLLAQAGNQNLVSLVTSLRLRSRIYGASALADRDELLPTLREHLDLLDLIERGDADAAAVLMARHIDHVRHEWASPLGLGRNAMPATA
jgi:DNA-binding GntR family transcriptional regulator